MGKQDTREKTQHNTKQTKKMTNRAPQEIGMNPSFREG